MTQSDIRAHLVIVEKNVNALHNTQALMALKWKQIYLRQKLLKQLLIMQLKEYNPN